MVRLGGLPGCRSEGLVQYRDVTEAPTFDTCFEGVWTGCVVSKDGYGVRNTKNVTLTTALVQWLADGQI